MPLSTTRISGVGHSLYGQISTLTSSKDLTSRYDFVLVTSWRGYKHLKKWNFKNVKYIRIPLPSRLLNRLPATPLMPPMDLLLGRGTYIFPNFRSWPLLFSKSITFVHDVSFLRHPEFVAPRNQRLLAKNVPGWIKRSSVVATVSEHAKGEIIKYLKIDEGKILVVPNGVDATEFYPRDQGEVGQVQKKYGLPSKYILYLGNIEPRKNIARLVRAYCALPAELSDEYPLAIVGGGGWLSGEIELEINKAKLKGKKIAKPDKYVNDKDLPAIYTGAVVLAHPALYEGFGISPLQAMACGVPVIVGNNSSLPEVVGDAGLYVNAEVEADITKKLRRLLEEKRLRQDLIAKGGIRVAEFSWERGTKNLADWINLNS